MKTTPALEPPVPLAVSPKVACAKLGIGRTKLYELIDSGAIRSIKIGRRRLIPVTAINECLTAHEVRP